jgi:hypothetical protein
LAKLQFLNDTPQLKLSYRQVLGTSAPFARFLFVVHSHLPPISGVDWVNFDSIEFKDGIATPSETNNFSCKG